MSADRPGRVVVGVDTTLAGLQALRRAVAEARARHASLYAVRAWNPPTPARSALAPDPMSLAMRHQPSRHEFRQAEAIQHRLVESVFADTMGGLPASLDVHMVTVPDVPGPALARYVSQDDDLLVLGADWRRPWRRLPRTVRYCVKHAACPVLVVPPPPLTRAGSPRALLRELRRDIDQLTSGGTNATDS